ncbi:MAG: hypothetical protein WA821_13285 [Anaerolineales bacterium]
MPTWQEKFKQEIDHANEVRARGNEGQARVCARRAAGIVIREYFARRGIRAASPSAYDLLKELLEMDDLPAEARRSAEYLTLRVTEEFKLPVDVDLVQEALTLCERLLPGT